MAYQQVALAAPQAPAHHLSATLGMLNVIMTYPSMHKVQNWANPSVNLGLNGIRPAESVSPAPALSALQRFRGCSELHAPAGATRQASLPALSSRWTWPTCSSSHLNIHPRPQGPDPPSAPVMTRPAGYLHRAASHVSVLAPLPGWSACPLYHQRGLSTQQAEGVCTWPSLAPHQCSRYTCSAQLTAGNIFKNFWQLLMTCMHARELGLV